MQKLFAIRHDEDGFTLVEILVVVLIIGILAAIAIPVFLNQRQRANDTNVQNDIHNAVIATNTYITNNPSLTTANWSIIKDSMTKNQNVRLTWTGDLKDFCIEGQVLNGREYVGNWTYSSLSGIVEKKNQGMYSCSGFGTTTHANHYVWNVS